MTQKKSKAKSKPKSKVDKPDLGRPTKFTEENKARIKVMCELGFTNVEIIEHLGIDNQTFYNWKKTHRAFFESMPDWKAGANERVENAFLKTCLGYHEKEVRPIVVADGGDSGSHVEMVEHKIYIKPSFPAQRFWLINRKGSDWRDRREYDINEVKNLSDDKIKEMALKILKSEESENE